MRHAIFTWDKLIQNLRFWYFACSAGSSSRWRLDEDKVNAFGSGLFCGYAAQKWSWSRLKPEKSYEYYFKIQAALSHTTIRFYQKTVRLMLCKIVVTKNTKHVNTTRGQIKHFWIPDRVYCCY
jgi:hypothetical protein